MAGAGGGFAFLHRGVGFVRGTGGQPILPCYASRRAFYRNSHFHACKPGFSDSDPDSRGHAGGFSYFYPE